MKMKSDFKVAKILDEYNVVINAGTDHDVSVGDKFQILDKTGSAVEDPVTSEIIGYLDLIKATVTVIEVQEKMSICTSEETVSIIGSIADNLAGISHSLAPYTQTEKEKLNVDNKQITGGLRKSNKPIRIGDDVTLVKSTKK